MITLKLKILKIVYINASKTSIFHTQKQYQHKAKLESGNFQSNLFKKYNNMFGMKHPYKRPTLAIGKTESGYAIFNSWEDSIIDYAFFQVYSAKGLNKNDYILFLNKHYAEDPNYDKKIINIINISIYE